MGPERYFYHMELSNIRIIFRFTLIYVPVFNSYANIKRRNHSIYVACGVLGFQNGI